MMGKSLILVVLALLCVVQCRRPSMRDFSRGMKPFQRDHGTLYRSEDDEGYRRQKDPMRSVNKFARNDEDEMTKAEEMMDTPSDMESPNDLESPSDMESPMSDEGEETFDGRSDMDLPLEEDDDVEEILASDEGENQTTQPPTEPSTTEAATTEAPSTTTEAPATTTESTTTTTESATTTTVPSSTSPPIAPSPGGLSEELAQALKGLSSKVAKQEKFCSYLMEKLQAAWSTTAAPATATQWTAFVTGSTPITAKSTTTPAESKTATTWKTTTESATLTGSPWGTVTPKSTADTTPKPVTDTTSVPTRQSTLVPSSEWRKALSRLSSKVSKQEKICSYLIEKLKDRIYVSLEARLKEIEASVMKSIGDIQVGRKRSASSLLENLLGQLRDLRIKMRKHRS